MSVVLISLTLFTVLIATLYLYVQNAFSHWKRRGVPYAEPSFPFGNFSKLFLQKVSFAELYEEFYDSISEPVFGIYMLLSPVLFVKDTKIIQDILISEFSSFSDRGMQGNAGKQKKW